MNRVMCHLVAGYPDMERSLLAAEAMAEGGASYLEVQFPFTDPAADGPAIQDASTRALEAGFTMREGFRLVEKIAAAVPLVPIFIMTYGSLAVRRGVDSFLKMTKDAGAAGVIIPDLPFDYDEGLYAAGDKTGIDVVPVVVPHIAGERLAGIRNLSPNYLYAALRAGITGPRTELGTETIAFLKRLRGWDTKVFAGFGITSGRQVAALAPYAEAAVVGSRLVGVIKENARAEHDAFRRAVAAAVAELCGAP